MVVMLEQFAQGGGIGNFTSVLEMGEVAPRAVDHVHLQRSYRVQACAKTPEGPRVLDIVRSSSDAEHHRIKPIGI